MLPFISEDLGQLLRSMMRLFLKGDAVKRETPLGTLVKTDVSDKAMWLDISKVKVGYLAERQLLKSKSASDRQRAEFRGACRDFLVALVKKLLQKAPVTYPLVRHLSWMDPREMVIDDNHERNMKKQKL